MDTYITRMLPRSNILVQVVTSNKNLDYNKHMMERNTPRPSAKVTEQPDVCAITGERRCEDGSCIPRVELCPEEQLMNQNTILIMIVVGLAVVVFLVILYCFQQRQRRANRALSVGDGTTGLTDNDYDNASLYAPPPSYEDVMNTNLYPPTPQQRRLQLTSTDEPMTPPPNYDTALVILAQSQDSVLIKSRRPSNVMRRSVSLEHVSNNSGSEQTSPNEIPSSNDTSDKTKSKSFFRFSQHFRKSGNSQSQQQQRSPHRWSLLQRQNSQQHQLQQQRMQLLRQTSVDQSWLQRQNALRQSQTSTQNSHPEPSPKLDSHIIEISETPPSTNIENSA